VRQALFEHDLEERVVPQYYLLQVSAAALIFCQNITMLQQALSLLLRESLSTDESLVCGLELILGENLLNGRLSLLKRKLFCEEFIEGNFMDDL